MQKNVQRLKEYRSKLILFPKNKKKLKKTDSSLEECSKAEQLRRRSIIAVPKVKPTAQSKIIKPKDKKFSCYNALKRERRNAKTWGRKQKKAMEAAEDAAVIKK
ncbi:60S ribosomal protein L13 [Armadillidium nasatum]|uniref:Large ribosomal subunit protein eL13 n=1 Tax=Armadillidium nasatum TaxID=96803 RepID=A0A5N5T4U4_9CRUS|nr:60S ribosomal protein L13 [Armadillidium nasatum]